MGYWIGEPYWHKGIATSAVKLMVEYGFSNLSFIRLFAGVFDSNKAPQKVLEKTGFALEEIHLRVIVKNNVVIDEYKFAII